MVTILVFAVILGILIFVHELGHFLVARRNGIFSEEFGFGFPPRIAGVWRDEKSGKLKFLFGKKKIKSKNTIYSLNLIPLGGFVKIKGEGGEGKNDPDSFAGKSAWIRIKVLAAGVIMNFLLAWAVISLAFMMGVPQPMEEGSADFKGSKIQISQVNSQSPAQEMGIKVGDEIIGCKNDEEVCRKNFQNVASFQDFINSHKGEKIFLEIKRGKSVLELQGVPRTETPSGQGALGISLVQTKIISYPFFEAIWEGLKTTVDLTIVIILTLFDLVKNLIIGEKISVDVSGPVGIAYLTKQVTELGFVYILQFMALLSINLGIINALPIPALDGGRIIFILIEKIKGSPVSHKFEQMAHSIGFALLIALMVFVTFRDLAQFNFIDKIKSLF